MFASRKAHPGDELLERYALGRLEEPELGELEEHILICESCQHRLDETADFVMAMREAAERLLVEPEPEPEWKRWLSLAWLPMPAPAMAGVFVVLLAFGVWQPWRSHQPAEWQTVALETVRGESREATASAGLALDLQLDVSDIDVTGARAQIVAADGTLAAEAPVTVANGKAQLRHAAGLQAGRYWIRLKKLGETVREYHLLVR